LTIPFAIPEFTDIFVPTDPGVGANTISLSVLAITARAPGQTPRLSRTEQQHSKSETQKCRQGSHRESLTGIGENGESVRGESGREGFNTPCSFFSHIHGEVFTASYDLYNNL